MKKKTASLISIITLLAFSYVIEGPLWNSTIRLLSFVVKDNSVAYLLPNIMFLVVPIICMFILYKSYLNFSNALKITLASVLITFLELLTIGTFRMLLKTICFLLILAILIGLFFWITRLRIRFDKRLFYTLIAMVGSVVVGIVASFIDAIITRMQLNMLGNEFYSYVSALSSGTIFGYLPLLAEYAIICLVFIYILFSIPQDTKPIASKKTQYVEDDEVIPEIPDGMWRCMGCGEILPQDITECDCGYKRIIK